MNKKISLFLCMAFLLQINVVDAAAGEEKESDRSSDNRKRKADDNDNSSQKKATSFRDEVIDVFKSKYAPLKEGFALLGLDYNQFLESQRNVIPEFGDANSEDDFMHEIVVAAEDIIIKKSQELLEQRFKYYMDGNYYRNLDDRAMRIIEYAKNYEFSLGGSMLRQFARIPNLLKNAVFNNNIEFVKTLIQKGADVNVYGNDYDAPLTIAAERGYVEIVRMLIDAGANVNFENDNITALMSAVKNNHVKIVRMLIGAEANVNTDGDTALIIAVEGNHVEIVRMLIDAGVDVDHQDYTEFTALMAAARAGKEKIVRMLIDAGADLEIVDNENETALMIADNYGNVAVAQMLTTALNISKGYTPLMFAVADEDVKKVRALIAIGVNIDQVNNESNTALMIAVQNVIKMITAKNEIKEIVKALILAGANVNIRNDENMTAIEMVEQDEDIEGVFQEAIAERQLVAAPNKLNI